MTFITSFRLLGLLFSKNIFSPILPNRWILSRWAAGDKHLKLIAARYI